PRACPLGAEERHRELVSCAEPGLVDEGSKAAVRERIGRFIAQREWVPAKEVDGKLVSKVSTLHTGRRPIADWTSVRAAAWGATRELSTVPDYRLTSRWAEAFDRNGFGALVYQPRFSTGDELAVALFGPQGTRTWAVRSSTSMRTVVVRMGIRVAQIPSSVETDDTAKVNFV
ncbi:MAG: hypothetical protein ACKOE2_08180, partial [Actinomycetales bacterium]